MTVYTMSDVIVPKSDQWNSDDFLTGPRTFTIREVQIKGGQEQPVNILLEDSDKAFRPCKSMSRVLVQAWGPDAKQYVGRRLTLYRDPSVKWGGLEVGGIRISHMSHIDGKMVMQLTATKGQRKPHIVMPIVAEVPPINGGKVRQTPDEWAAAHIAEVANTGSFADLERVQTDGGRAMGKLKAERAELHAEVLRAYHKRLTELRGPGAEEPADDDEDIIGA